MPFGFVYILENVCMPGVYKIGCTERSPSLRAKELSGSTGVPTDFQVLAYYEVSDCFDCEREVHQRFAADRVDPAREFFRVDFVEVHSFIVHNLYPFTTSAGRVEREIDARADEAREAAAKRKERADWAACQAAMWANIHDADAETIAQCEEAQRRRETAQREAAFSKATPMQALRVALARPRAVA